MSQFMLASDASRKLGNSTRTIENWQKSRYIKSFDDGSGRNIVDFDEIERAFRVHPQMRDPRKRRGGTANRVIIAIAVPPEEVQ